MTPHCRLTCYPAPSTRLPRRFARIPRNPELWLAPSRVLGQVKSPVLRPQRRRVFAIQNRNRSALHPPINFFSLPPLFLRGRGKNSLFSIGILSETELTRPARGREAGAGGRRMAVNSVTVIGNVGATPEVRTLPSGQSVANLSLATTDR